MVEFERDVLLGIGEWLKVNGEAIYGTKANPFDHTFDWGEVTAKEDALYLHLLKLPEDRVIRLAGLKGPAPSVDVLGDKRDYTFKVKRTKEGTNFCCRRVLHSMEP